MDRLAGRVSAVVTVMRKRLMTFRTVSAVPATIVVRASLPTHQTLTSMTPLELQLLEESALKANTAVVLLFTK